MRLHPQDPLYEQINKLQEELYRQKNVSPYDNFSEPKYRRIAQDVSASLLNEIESTISAFK